MKCECCEGADVEVIVTVTNVSSEVLDQAKFCHACAREKLMDSTLQIGRPMAERQG